MYCQNSYADFDSCCRDMLEIYSPLQNPSTDGASISLLPTKYKKNQAPPKVIFGKRLRFACIFCISQIETVAHPTIVLDLY